MANPIWKDCLVTLGTGDQVQYRIRIHDTENVIYVGRAYKRPGDTSIAIRINDICADYMSATMDSFFQNAMTSMPASVTFDVDTYISTAQGEPEDWEYLTEVEMTKDWSYDYSFNPATQGMAFPINGRLSPRQDFLYYAYSNQDAYLVYSGDVDIDMEEMVAQCVNMLDLSTARFNGLESISIAGYTYEVVKGCNRYVLHYLNAYGGWDSFLIEGNVKEQDNLTKHDRQVEYSNRSISNRGTMNYVNEIEKTYTLHTGYMTDDEASRMHHLIESTDVYLEDTLTKQVMPVTITDTSHEYKTFRNQGCRMVDYEISVSVAQNRVRR